MIGYRQTLLVLAMAMTSVVTMAQNNTNSPYTRYGYGQLSDLGTGSSKAMGGIAYGVRDKYQVNFANPASYTSIDSLTFLFDGGIGLQNTNFSNGTLKRNAHNSSIDYIAMQFRVTKWLAMSAGLLPYSNVGYGMTDTRNNSTMQVSYAGEGGFHQLYGGLAVRPFTNLSVGANFSYFWGDITHSMAETFPSDASAMPFQRTMNMAMKSYKIDLGVQYTQHFGKKHAVTVGAVFSPGHNLNNNSAMQYVLGNSSTGYTSSTTDTLLTTGIPTSFGAGFTYTYNKQLTVGFDASIEKWGNVTYMNQNGALADQQRFSIGAELYPNPLGRNYLAHIRYRIGAFFKRPYYKIEGVRAAKEYGVTAGFGFPVWGNRSRVNVSAQYVRTKGSRAAFLDEQTIRLNIGITFNESWFFKSKVD